MPSKQSDQTKEQTLADGESITIVIGKGVTGRAIVQIDDGTTDGTPATYDIVARVYNPDESDYQFYDAETGIQERSLVDPLFEDKQEYELTNQSGGQATFRMRVMAVGGVV